MSSDSGPMLEIDEYHLWLVVSFVLLLGPDPYLIAQILWLLLVIGFYFIPPGTDMPDMPAQEGIGGKA